MLLNPQKKKKKRKHSGYSQFIIESLSIFRMFDTAVNTLSKD